MWRLKTRSRTCSGNVVSWSSVSCSPYSRMVFRERRRESSLKEGEVPTRELKDMVTCILTRAKFCEEKICKF